ncbi:MAG TPA: hopanoid biosynthesis-associated protein HpnK [Verrucomicrobiae bacterium]|jgi:hopanoid biosynthesis associated protein HpnK|nr:hopanoid biosynthesis-associated protein HpnK [Verrucomicrobiae bacterium]
MALSETPGVESRSANLEMNRPPAQNGTATRRLIVNADDFGRSRSINEAVIRAHREGILTSASLMVNEVSCGEAVELAKQNPGLGVGLHLTLLMGHSALPQSEIPGLVNERQELLNDPVKVGFRYFFQRSLREQLRREIHAQFARFRATGLPLDHVNGHLHLHLHPTVFGILMEDASVLGIERMRLTHDPFWMDVPLARGRRLYRALHAVVHYCLSGRARPVFRKKQIHHTQQVFGLLQNDRVDETYILKLLSLLPAGDSELYSHPSLDNFKHEFDALISPRVKEQVKMRGIQLIRYQDL